MESIDAVATLVKKLGDHQQKSEKAMSARIQEEAGTRRSDQQRRDYQWEQR